MIDNNTWSWILTIVGLTGFILVGRKIWWAWWINIGCQVLWISYAILSQQYGFLLSAGLYSIVFGMNVYKAWKDHKIVSTNPIHFTETYDPDAKPGVETYKKTEDE